MGEFCNVHEQEVGVINNLALGLETMAADVRWIRRIGTFIGTMLVVLLPFVVGVLVYLAKLDNRVSLIEYQISQLKEQQLKEHRK